MYKTVIEINDKKIPIRFGSYVNKLLADNGVKLVDLKKKMEDNPYDLLPRIFYYGAINASPERKGENVSINDIYDWLDELPGGILSGPAQDLFNLYINSQEEGVPKNPIAEEQLPEKITDQP